MTRRSLPSDPLNLLRATLDEAPPEGAASRVAARLAGNTSLAAAASGAPRVEPAVTSTEGLRALGRRFVRWSLAPLGVGIALGVGGSAWLTPRLSSAPPLPAPPSAPPSSSAASLELLPMPMPAVPTSSRAPALKARTNTLGEERSLLDKARRQLASDEPARALTFLERHAERFARGELVEEREAMWVNVLVRLGRREEAKTRCERFEARFPNSLMGPTVRAALDAASATE